MRLLSTLKDIFTNPVLHTAQAAMTIQTAAAQQQRDRITRINNAWKVYASGGDKPLVVMPERPDDNTIINYCRVIVELGANFLFGRSVEFDIKGEREPDEEWLENVWQKNDKDVLLHDIAVNGGVAGDAFVKIVKDPAMKVPRLVNIDPASIYALWDPDDIERVVEYRIEWVGIDPKTGKPLARRQSITRGAGNWVIADWVSYDNDVQWTMLGQEVWPYAWCPIFKTKNLPAPNEFYGTPDLTDDIIHINDRVNFIASNTSKIIRHHAHPKTWGRGFTSQQVDMSPDTVTIVHNADGTLQNLEMSSDLQSSLNWYKYLVHGLHTVAGIPEVATGRVESIGQLSGVALEILYGPIVEKTRTKRMLYGSMLNAINEALLEMNGTNGEVICRWNDPWPVDNLTEAQIGIMYKTLGVSKRSILERIGYDYDREKRQAEADGDAEDDAVGTLEPEDVGGRRAADIRPSRTARKTFTKTD